MRGKVTTRIQKQVESGYETAQEQIDGEYEVSRFALNVGMGMAALIGIWGLTCLVGGLTTNGIGGLLRGFWIAVTGS